MDVGQEWHIIHQYENMEYLVKRMVELSMKSKGFVSIYTVAHMILGVWVGEDYPIPQTQSTRSQGNFCEPTTETIPTKIETRSDVGGDSEGAQSIRGIDDAQGCCCGGNKTR